MRLPPELSNWAELLKLFPEDIAISLGAIIRSSSVAIGPMKKKVLFGESEPYGFQGIHNKGSITHLLPSEWLLADEFPDEFNRRAAMNEQLYFYPEKVEPKQSLVSTVLFDSGLSQLGGPRIVHLALLILMARRAQASKAEFYWGVLQKAPKGWQAEVNPDTIENDLLKSIATCDVTEDAVDQWKSHLASLGTVTDKWVIGGDSIEGADKLGTLVRINEEIDPESKKISIHIHKSAVAATFQVELPDDTIAARILRDPFNVPKSETKRSKYKINSQQKLQFSQNSRKIQVGIKGGVMSYPIPNSPAMKIGKPRVFRAYNKELLVAYEVLKKGVCAVTHKGNKLVFRRFPQSMAPDPLTIKLAKSGFKIPPPGQSSGRLFIFPGQTRSQVYLIDSENSLFLFEPFHQYERTIECKGPMLFAPNVMAAKTINRTLVYATYDEINKEVRIHFAGEATKTVVPIEDGASGSTYLGSTGWSKDGNGLMAVNTKGSMWQLFRNGKNCFLSPPSGTTVVGVINAPVSTSDKAPYIYDEQKSRPALVLLESDRQEATLLHRHGLKRVFRLTETIDQIEVDSQNNLIAVVTSNGILKVFSVNKNAFLMEVLPGIKE